MWSPLTLYYKSLVSSKFIQPFFSPPENNTHTQKTTIQKYKSQPRIHCPRHSDVRWDSRLDWDFVVSVPRLKGPWVWPAFWVRPAEVLDHSIMGDHTYSHGKLLLAGARHQMTMCGIAEWPVKRTQIHTQGHMMMFSSVSLYFSGRQA